MRSELELSFRERQKPQQITEEMGLHKEWFEEAKQQTLKTLPKFLDHLMNDYIHDYGTTCHAISAGAVATAWAMNKHKQGSLTGFQSNFVLWGFIRGWDQEEGGPMRLTKFKDMLYPWCESNFHKTISPRAWKWLQEEAKKNLEEGIGNPEVKLHWSNIVQGVVPFGYSVKRD